MSSNRTPIIIISIVSGLVALAAIIAGIVIAVNKKKAAAPVSGNPGDPAPPEFPPPQPGQFPRYIKARDQTWYNASPTGQIINLVTNDQTGTIKIIVNGATLSFKARIQDATGSRDFESTWVADDTVQGKTFKIDYSPTQGVVSTEV